MNNTNETGNDLAHRSRKNSSGFNAVKDQEKVVIQAGRCAEDEPDKFVGLAFSGGGIRSATFNLGVLQGLAEAGLLKRFDYLSTVSGGGYIGSWFSALLHRKAATISSGTQQENTAAALGRLQEELQPAPKANQKNELPNGKTAIQWLRRYSAYLTPHYGLMSLDTLAAVAGLFRNLLLNQTILVSLLMATLLGPYLLFWMSQVAVANQHAWMNYLISIAATVTLLIAILGIRLGLTSSDSDRGNALPYVLTALVGSILAALLFHLDQLLKWNSLPCLASAGAVIYLAGFFPVKRQEWRISPWILLTSATLGGMFYGYGMLLEHVPVDLLAVFSLTLGPVIIIQILCMAAIVHTGLVGRGFSEMNREWLGRAGGQVFALEMAWVTFNSLALLSPALDEYLDAWLAYSGGAAWALGSVATFWFARSDKSGEKDTKPVLEKGLSIAPYLIMTGLLIILSNVLHIGLLAFPNNGNDPSVIAPEIKIYNTQKQNTPGQNLSEPAVLKPSPLKYIASTMTQDEKINPLALPVALVIFIFVGAGLAWRVDINLFSMHQFYRNRLTRAYLGASNTHRNPNPFTDFDDGDDLSLSELAQQRPVHLVNTTLNLTGIEEKELQWQERRGVSFVFTPHYCGFQLSAHRQYYVPTSRYMSVMPDKKGVLLGTAVAISGAAASPNMGYHSSRPLAFLMTFCNVRLGRWCPNPANGKIGTLGPQFGLRYLISELAGSTSDVSKYVNLTDGGHFENLGIYELVRRRCRLILVSDAGADNVKGFEYEDLGNAINKCRVDFGASIEMYGMDKISPMHSQSRAAWGHITYADGSLGALIYLKPVLRGNEPVDVFHYAAVHKDFPHQSTGDQWFEESQFESYRELGLITVQETLRELGIEKFETEKNCDTFADELYKHIKNKHL